MSSTHRLVSSPVQRGRCGRHIDRCVTSALLLFSGCYSVSLQSLPELKVGDTEVRERVILLVLHDDEQPSPLVVITNGSTLSVSGPCDRPDAPVWIPAATAMSSMQFARGKIFVGQTVVDESKVCARSIASCDDVGPCGDRLGRFTIQRDRPCSQLSDGQESEFKYSTNDGDGADWKPAEGAAADQIRCSLALELKPTS